MTPPKTTCCHPHESQPNEGDGSLKGANLGVVAFRVLSVTARADGSSSSLPAGEIEILDADEFCVCDRLEFMLGAPAPDSSSEPFDVNPEG